MAKKDVRDLIVDHIYKDDRNLAWLAKKAQISYAHLYFILIRKERELTEENRKLINSILSTNF